MYQAHKGRVNAYNKRNYYVVREIYPFFFVENGYGTVWYKVMCRAAFTLHTW